MRQNAIAPMFSATDRSILLPGEYWRGAMSYAVAHGLRLAGNCVTEIDSDTFFVTGKLGRLITPLARREYNQTILATADRTAAQIVLTCKGNNIQPATLDALGRAGILSVNFYPDYHFDHPCISPASLERYDLFVSTKSFHLDYLRDRHGEDRCAYIPHGYSSDVHRPVYPVGEVERYEWDIGYVGTASPYKLTWLVGIANAFPDHRFIVFGNGWNKLAAGTPLAPHVAGGAITGDYLAKVFELTRINVAIHSGPHPTNGWMDLTSTRTFEIPACGGFALHIDSAELRDFYDVPEEMTVFSTCDELAARIDHYLRHDDERRAIIRRSYARTVPAYSVDRRAGDLLDFINRAAPAASRSRA